MPPACTPPVILLGEIVSDFSDGGSTLNEGEADPELSVAVRVTGVEVVTCPACIWNWVHAVLPGMVIVAGTGAAAGFELVRLMVAPLAGTAALSCTATQVVSPLYSGLRVSVTDWGVGGTAGAGDGPGRGRAVAARRGGAATGRDER